MLCRSRNPALHLKRGASVCLVFSVTVPLLPLPLPLVFPLPQLPGLKQLTDDDVWLRRKAPNTLVLHGRVGNCIGDMASYDYFTLGGPYSVRGYSPGELGACRCVACVWLCLSGNTLCVGVGRGGGLAGQLEGGRTRADTTRVVGGVHSKGGGQGEGRGRGVHDGGEHHWSRAAPPHVYNQIARQETDALLAATALCSPSFWSPGALWRLPLRCGCR